MNENEFTGPDGTRYQAVDSDEARFAHRVPCNKCALTGRLSGCPIPRVWPGEPRCSKSNRKDHRNIYWVIAEVEPNPL